MVVSVGTAFGLAHTEQGKCEGLTTVLDFYFCPHFLFFM